MKTLLMLLSLFFGSKELVTPQIPDTLIYKGKKYEWNGYSPAFDYFKSHNFEPPKEAVVSTGNYSVFLMTYEIIDRKLFLTDVEILVKQASKYGSDFPEIVEKSVFKNYFPGRKRIPMDFYSNIQIIPYGEIIEVTKDNWTDIHWENYLVFEIENGITKKEFDLTYKRFDKLKNRQFQAFKKTTKYQKALEEQKKNLASFNEFRPNKWTMDEYLEFIILRLVKQLK